MVALAIPDVIGAFGALNALVIGDVMLDSYLSGRAGALCREAPVPIVTLTNRVDTPGGAANTAANACSLGSNVSLLSVVGDDAEGRLLLGLLRQRGIATEHVLAC